MASANTAAPAAPRSELPASTKRLRWFEVYLVLLVACGASFLNSLYIFRFGPGAMPHISNIRWSMSVVQEMTSLLLLGYVLSRRNLRLQDLGLRWSLRDVGAGVLVVGASYVAYVAGYLLVHFLRSAIFPSAAMGPTAGDFFAHPSFMAIPFSLLNPFFEELIVRAYLMTEVTELTGSRALAVALSVLVQASYHLYYGWVGALDLSCQFLVFALYYARFKQALPVIVAHEFFDIFALVRLW
ncbi:MAG TPA: CPBP family intramembrane glutamic endopeptidase [Candidatus Acidoferrales bacterium]|nr:CPBP family intramembrane glutamic endopeptidase [Candidatus Acidoferrales bacterium]